MITFEQFHSTYFGEIIPNKPSFVRSGQALMNFLQEIWPEEYDRITQGEYEEDNLDCFYSDVNVSHTLFHLQKVWKK
jgi:hypothetical protein